MRYRLTSLLISTAFALALTSCSSGESDRDQALGALDRATQAANLETQMASLVADIPDDPDQQQTQKVTTSVQEIDTQAETILASTDTGKAYDQKISESVTETQGAGSEIATAVDDPDQLGKARTKAIGRLSKSNKNLKDATGLIGKDLADEQGNLPSEDAEALEETLVAVDDSEQAVIAAGEEVIPIENCPLESLTWTFKVRQISCAEGKRVADKAFDQMCDKVCDKIDINVPELHSFESKASFGGWTCAGSVYFEGYNVDCVNGLSMLIYSFGA